MERVSAVHGVGQFATRDFHAGERVNDKYNVAGFNHSNAPNVIRRVDSNGALLGIYALRNLVNGEELFLNYRIYQKRHSDGSLTVEVHK